MGGGTQLVWGAGEVGRDVSGTWLSRDSWERAGDDGREDSSDGGRDSLRHVCSIYRPRTSRGVSVLARRAGAIASDGGGAVVGQNATVVTRWTRGTGERNSYDLRTESVNGLLTER